MSRHISLWFLFKENPDPSFYYQHPPPSPHHAAASKHRDRQQIGRASHHQNRRPLLACAIGIPLQWSLARRNHCLMNVGKVLLPTAPSGRRIAGMASLFTRHCSLSNPLLPRRQLLRSFCLR
ncbi:hypothetical protein V8C43DRAFT_205088 [Trichoderma afarasin]